MASDHRFSDVRRYLESKGYQLARIAGSHHVFTRGGHEPISIPVHRGKVKDVYVRKIRKTLDDKSEGR